MVYACMCVCVHTCAGAMCVWGKVVCVFVICMTSCVLLCGIYVGLLSYESNGLHAQ